MIKGNDVSLRSTGGRGAKAVCFSFIGQLVAILSISYSVMEIMNGY